MARSFFSQTVTATGTTGNFSLSLPTVAEGEESGSILADVVGGNVATDAEVKAAVEVIAGQVRHCAWLWHVLITSSHHCQKKVGGHGTGSGHSRVEEYPRKKKKVAQACIVTEESYTLAKK